MDSKKSWWKEFGRQWAQIYNSWFTKLIFGEGSKSKGRPIDSQQISFGNPKLQIWAQLGPNRFDAEFLEFIQNPNGPHKLYKWIPNNSWWRGFGPPWGQIYNLGFPRWIVVEGSESKEGPIHFLKINLGSLQL